MAVSVSTVSVPHEATTEHSIPSVEYRVLRLCSACYCESPVPHYILIFDVNGQVKGVFGSEGKSDGQFNGVCDVCVTSKGWIVASDGGNNRIEIFDEHGRFVRTFGSRGSGDGKLNVPHGVAMDEKGLIYVCDRLNHRVQVFSEDGKFVRQFRPEGNVPFFIPKYLSVTPNGRVGDSPVPYKLAFLFIFSQVVVSNYSYMFGPVSPAVNVFDEYGRHLFYFGWTGTKESQFMNPAGIATDDHGNIIVVDSHNHRVQVFTRDGEFVSCFGSFGFKPGEMWCPTGVCLLSDGGIAVWDGLNSRVQIF